MLPFVTTRLDMARNQAQFNISKLQNSPTEFDIGLESDISKVWLIPTYDYFQVDSFEHITILC
jgi:hypothetical protein